VHPHGKVTVDIDTKVADVLYRGNWNATRHLSALLSLVADDDDGLLHTIGPQSWLDLTMGVMNASMHVCVHAREEAFPDQLAIHF